MPGAGSLTAANYIYSVAKPDGLTIGFVTPGLYFNQLTDMKEVKFDWAKFSWIGSPERTVRIIYGRADTPYKNLEDIRNAPEQPRCGATALGTVGHYFPRLIEEVAGVKFGIVTGYPGAAEIDLAMQKGEVQCRAGSLEGYFGSEPTRAGPRVASRGCWCTAAPSEIRDCLTCRRSMRFWTNGKRPM